MAGTGSDPRGRRRPGEQAVRLAAAAEALRDAARDDLGPPERDVYERTAQSLRADLGEAAFLAAWAAGRALSQEEAVAEGEAVLRAIPPATPAELSAPAPSAA